MKRLSLIICFVLILANFLFAQTVEDYSRLEGNKSAEIRQSEQMETARSARSLPGLGESLPKMPFRKKIYSGKLSKEQKKLIIPSEENLLKYKQFLETPKTGIVKILSDPKCDANVVDANNLKCVNVIPIYGYGAMYSFSEETHTKPNTAEIFLIDDFFKVGFLGNFSSLIVDLGDKDINSIGENTEEAKVLSSIAPVKVYSKFLSQKQIIDKGISFNGRNYKTGVLAKINHAYILRSIKYYSIRYFALEYYYDDITIAFRVVEKDSEGNMTLIWKELARKKKVNLAR